MKKELDAAWAPEPWATRLIREGNGRLFLDERTLWPNGQFVCANLIVSTKFLKEHPDVVKNWLRAHVELTDWINGHLPEAKKVLNGQIQKETGKALPDAVLDEAFSRLQVTYDPLRTSLLTSAKSAFDAGFLGRTGAGSLEPLRPVFAEPGSRGKKEEGGAMRPNTNLATGVTWDTEYRKPAQWHGGSSRRFFSMRRPNSADPQGSTRRCFSELLQRNRCRSACARSNQPASAAGRIPLHRRPLGLRQIDPAALDRVVATPDLRRHRHR